RRAPRRNVIGEPRIAAVHVPQHAEDEEQTAQAAQREVGLERSRELREREDEYDVEEDFDGRHRRSGGSLRVAPGHELGNLSDQGLARYAGNLVAEETGSRSDALTYPSRRAPPSRRPPAFRRRPRSVQRAIAFHRSREPSRDEVQAD